MIDTSDDSRAKALCTLPPSEEYMQVFKQWSNPLLKPWTTTEDARAILNETFEEPIVKWFESRLPRGMSV